MSWADFEHFYDIQMTMQIDEYRKLMPCERNLCAEQRRMLPAHLFLRGTLCELTRPEIDQYMHDHRNEFKSYEAYCEYFAKYEEYMKHPYIQDN
eukprot:COSAG01_NODE_24624_length_772_cov_2.588410_2_plen_94_part_00